MGVHHHKAPIVTDGLVFHVDAANKIGTDEVLNTVNNIVTPSQLGTPTNYTTPTVTDPIVGGIFTFDGIDDYLDFTDLSDFDFSPPSAHQFSVSVWVNVSNFSGGSKMLINKSVGNNGWIFFLSSTLFRFGLVQNNSTYAWSTTGSIGTAGWKNIVGVWDGTTMSASTFVNSVEDTNQASEGTLTSIENSQPLVIGKSGSSFYNDNDVSQCSIYNRALSADEIKQNYESQKHRFE